MDALKEARRILLDAIFHWPSYPETAELFDRMTAMLEVVKQDLDKVAFWMAD